MSVEVYLYDSNNGWYYIGSKPCSTSDFPASLSTELTMMNISNYM